MYAAKHIPEEKHSETLLYILATAGMRVLPERYVNLGLVSLFNGISTLCRLFNAEAILLEEQ